MTKYINTSGEGGPEWVLSSLGIIDRIREILDESGSVEVYGINPSRSNLPATFDVSTSEGVLTVRLSVGSSSDVENQIRKSLKPYLSKEVSVLSEDTEVSEEPEESVEFIPSPKLEEIIEEASEDPKKKASHGSRSIH